MAREISKDDIISNVYYDPAEGFGSVKFKDILKKAKEKDSSITTNDVRALLKRQPNKQIRKHRGYNSYTAPFARYQYQIDIMDMVPLTKDRKEEGKKPKNEIKIVKNDEPRYGLALIHIFSKLANVVPMENKDATSVLNGLQESFEKMGFPMSVYSDDDSGFKSVVKDFFQREGINHITTLTHANVAERCIRTIKNKVHDRVRFNKGSWVKMVDFAVKQYNRTVHSSTKEKPIEAHKDENHVDVKVNLYSREKNNRKYDSISVGDMVKIFSKGSGNYTDRKEYLSKWSKEDFRVERIDYDSIGNRVFRLAGKARPYLRHEIFKVWWTKRFLQSTLRVFCRVRPVCVFRRDSFDLLAAPVGPPLCVSYLRCFHSPYMGVHDFRLLQMRVLFR